MRGKKLSAGGRRCFSKVAKTADDLILSIVSLDVGCGGSHLSPFELPAKSEIISSRP